MSKKRIENTSNKPPKIVDTSKTLGRVDISTEEMQFKLKAVKVTKLSKSGKRIP